MKDTWFFLSGPGGTEKSHVIFLKWIDMVYFFDKIVKLDDDQPQLLHTAHTGSAAFHNIGTSIPCIFIAFWWLWKYMLRKLSSKGTWACKGDATYNRSNKHGWLWKVQEHEQNNTESKGNTWQQLVRDFLFLL